MPEEPAEPEAKKKAVETGIGQLRLDLAHIVTAKAEAEQPQGEIDQISLAENLDQRMALVVVRVWLMVQFNNQCDFLTSSLPTG